MTNAYLNWSGGKDASFALWHLQQAGTHDVKYLFTTLSAVHKRVSMHGVREELLDEQARQTGIPLVKAYLPENASMEDYNHIMHDRLAAFRQENIGDAVFGDIFLEDLRTYRESQLAQVNMQGVFPLWKKDSTQLVKDFIAAGFKAVIVCVNAKYLPASFAGRLIDETFLADLPAGVDPCGENGEFHSFVFEGPIFKAPVAFNIGETVERTYAPVRNDGGNCYKDDGENDSSGQPGYWDTRFFFCDLLPG